MKIDFLNFDSFHRPLQSELIAASKSVIESNHYVLGSEVEAFEHELARWNDSREVVSVSNGLDALVLSLRALNIGPDDEVIVPAHTFIASFLAISQVGATPVPVEPRIETGNINPVNIIKAITSKTKAIMVVHLYGQPCEMFEIQKIANDYGLLLVEDNAQSIGAKLANINTGNFGDVAATSFYPGKNLGALGDGGAIFLKDENLGAVLRKLRNYGSSEKYVHDVIGYNNRLDEIQASFLRVKLKHLTHWNQARSEIAEQYLSLINWNLDLKPIELITDATSVYHLFVVRSARRVELQNFLAEHSIQTLVHYPTPPHLQKAYHQLGYRLGDFPIAECLASEVLSLPIWPGLSLEEIEYISTIINKFHEAINSKS